MNFFSVFKSEIRVFAVLAAFIAIVLVFFITESSSFGIFSSSSNEDTSRWKTYENKEFGFTIKHPDKTSFHTMLNGTAFVLEGINKGKLIVSTQDLFPRERKDEDIKIQNENVLFQDRPVKMRISFVVDKPVEVALYDFMADRDLNWGKDAEIVIMADNQSTGALLEEILSTFRFVENS